MKKFIKNVSLIGDNSRYIKVLKENNFLKFNV